MRPHGSGAGRRSASSTVPCRRRRPRSGSGTSAPAKPIRTAPTSPWLHGDASAAIARRFLPPLLLFALLPLLLLLLLFLLPAASDFGVVRLEVALDPRRQPADFIRSTGAAVEMPAEGIRVVEDLAAIGQCPACALAPLGIAGNPPAVRPVMVSIGKREVVRRRLSFPAQHELEGHFPPFVQRNKAGPLDGADMDEHVLGAILRLDEPVTLCVPRRPKGARRRFVDAVPLGT